MTVLIGIGYRVLIVTFFNDKEARAKQSPSGQIATDIANGVLAKHASDLEVKMCISMTVPKKHRTSSADAKNANAIVGKEKRFILVIGSKAGSLADTFFQKFTDEVIDTAFIIGKLYKAVELDTPWKKDVKFRLSPCQSRTFKAVGELFGVLPDVMGKSAERIAEANTAIFSNFNN